MVGHGCRVPFGVTARHETSRNDGSPRWPALRVAQWAAIIALLVISEVVSLAGHVGASWMIDGVAVLVFAGFTLARRMKRTRAVKGHGVARTMER